ncbi:hypothetical protein [Mycolicibacterium celeriflavum]|uniref:hypothetical protein n=1 Tax=Mycolicibacterium celeriflavum TaxID=1249101 RepID=UPI000A6B2838|nr:hypothetical protein [Mycolicibacterium celeriflavum]
MSAREKPGVILTASAELVAARHAGEIAAADVPGGPSISQTILLPSLRALMSLLPPESSVVDYRSAVIDDNVLGKETDSGRKRVFRQLRELYALDPSSLLFRALRDLWDYGVEGQPLLALLCAIGRDRLLRASSSVILAADVGSEVQRVSFELAVEESFPGIYKPSIRQKVGRNVASSWEQSGHLVKEARIKKVRARAACTPTTAAYALMLGHLEGQRGQALFTTLWSKLLDQPMSQLVELAATASQLGMIEFRHAGGVVEVGFSRLLRPFDGA